jgi:peptide chain release factor 1
MDAAKEMLDTDDEEMKELAKMEIADLEDKIPEMENDLKILLLPKDPNDDKNVILEVRAGTGGEEAFGTEHERAGMERHVAFGTYLPPM